MSGQKNNSHEPKAFRERFLIGINDRYKTLDRNLSSLAACIASFRQHAVTTIAHLEYQAEGVKVKYVRGNNI